MKPRILYVILLFAILLFTLPVTAQAEEGMCSSSSVKITEENKRFSVLVPKSSGLGNKQAYDDIGCAVMARNEECATRQTMFDGAALAYDQSTGAEFPAEKMYFVLKTDVITPRGFGIVAFMDKVEAEAFSARHGKGKVVKWYQLVDESLKR
ncbi:MAG: hypothetical protein WC001_02695 [Desulfurivibrionaceae bacterium]